MKKLFMLALTVLMVLPMSLIVSSALPPPPVTLDLSEVLEESGNFQPGKTYYIPMLNGSYNLEKDELERYRFQVTVTNKADGSRKGASVSITSIGSYRYVKFSSTASVANKENQIFEIKLAAYDKVDKLWVEPETAEVEVGFGAEVFCSGNDVTIDNEEPIVEFADDVTDCMITFPDGSKYAAVLQANSKKNQDEGIYRKINLYSTTSDLQVIANKYPNYDLEYLNFSTGTVFGDKSLLRVYAPNMQYIYRVRNQDELVKINYTRSGDFMVFTTKTLDTYVLSKVELPAAPATTTTTTTTGSTVAAGTLAATQAGTAADSAFNGGASSVRFTGVGTVNLDAMQTIASKARAKGISSVVYFDTMTVDGGVESRIYAYPALATKAFSAVARIDDAAVGTVRTTFGNWFKNKVAVIYLGQAGDFGMQVNVATKLNLAGMNASNLAFYSYSSTANTYSRIAAPAYWVDGSGYLHFSTTMGNYIVVSDGALASK